MLVSGYPLGRGGGARACIPPGFGAESKDNTCHFGVNNFFSDLGLESSHAPPTQLFFPADVHQTQHVVEAIMWQSL